MSCSNWIRDIIGDFTEWETNNAAEYHTDQLTGPPEPT